MDFQIELHELDEARGEVSFVMSPDPQRYECVETDGETMLFDRLDSTFIPARLLGEMADQMAGVPMLFAPPKIDDATTYIGSRRSQIATQLAGESLPAELSDPSGDLLAELAGHELDFAVISVDLVGSTKLATTTPPAQYALVIQTLLNELSAVAPLFRGQVLKYTGDGLIVFVPGPSMNTQNDLAIDCALTMRALVYDALNPEFIEAGLPPIDIRVGIDAGEAAVLVLGSPTTKRHADIIGEVVSLACKVEATGEAGAIRVGGIAARSMHLHWRELMEPAPMPDGWAYTDEDGSPYEIHQLTSAPTPRELAPESPAARSGEPIVGIEVDEHGPLFEPAHRSEDR